MRRIWFDLYARRREFLETKKEKKQKDKKA